jgi:hypothetical protein
MAGSTEKSEYKDAEANQVSSARAALQKYLHTDT